MKEHSFIIDGQPMSKKRNYRMIRYGNRPALGLKHTYRKWEKDAVDQLEKQALIYQASMEGPWKPIPGPVQVSFVFRMKDKAKYDLSNLIQGPEDALVKAKILKDDSLIASLDGSRKIAGHPTPGITIVIRPFKEV
jgi:Holliday junction resolvase RusA-like endonuclease